MTFPRGMDANEYALKVTPAAKSLGMVIRKAQWFWDIVAAENGMGAHNPGGNMNILGQAIDLAHQAIEAANQANSTTKQ